MKKPETSISVRGVYKTFRLPHQKHGSVKNALFSFLKSGKRKSFEKQKVLNDIDFEVKKGEFFGIVGRNGSGKSTLLKLIAGIYAPDSGKISVNGKLTPFIELGVGFNPELTGRENVYLNGALLGFSRTEVEDMYDDIVDFAEMQKFMDQQLKNYSSGMQVRLAFAIAIRAETDVLLIDEVLAVGDSKFQAKCFKFFEDIKGKKTVIFISHDMKSVERFCDRVMILEKSNIVDIGKPQDMIFKYGALMSNEEFNISSKKSNEKGVHLGNGEVNIGKVGVLSDGKTTGSLKPGQQYSIGFSYDSKIAVDECIVNASVFNDKNQKVLSVSTEKSGIKVSLKKGKGKVSVSLGKNNLAPGLYKVNVGIFSEGLGYAYDHFRDATTFRVLGSGEVDYILEVPCEWSV